MRHSIEVATPDYCESIDSSYVLVALLQAFVKLESLPAIPEPKKAAYAEVALGVFTANAPADPVTLKEAVAAGDGGGSGRHDGLMDDLQGLDRDQVRESVVGNSCAMHGVWPLPHGRL